MNSVLHTYIVFQLGQRHIPQAAIAACAGVTPSLVNQVIRGTKRSKRVQGVLLSALGFSSWPELVGAAYRFQEIVQSMQREVTECRAR